MVNFGGSFFSLSLFNENSCQILARECALSYGKLEMGNDNVGNYRKCVE